MYVHLGGGCLIRAAEIIGIFSVKDNKEFSDAVIDYVGTISSVEEITPIHVLLTFNRLFRDGVEITPDKL